MFLFVQNLRLCSVFFAEWKICCSQKVIFGDSVEFINIKHFFTVMIVDGVVYIVYFKIIVNTSDFVFIRLTLQ